MTPSAQHSPEYIAIVSKHEQVFKQLAITAEIEKAVTDYLEDLGVLQSCGVGSRCVGGCRPGQDCIPGHRRCFCSTSFRVEGDRIVPRGPLNFSADR